MTGNGQENSAVLVLYNRPAADAGESDRGVLDEVAAVTAALKRSNIPCRTAGARRLEDVLPLLQAGQKKVPTLRQAVGGDRETIMSMLHGAGVFRPEECLVGEEVFQDGILRGPASGYSSLVAETNGLVCGWLCHGPVPRAVAAHDIYWIVTATGHQGRGIGSALLRQAEEEIRQQGGRLVTVETSGSPLYAPARSFYLRHGYTAEAIVRDFYQPGDDKIILTKRLDSRTANRAPTFSKPE